MQIKDFHLIGKKFALWCFAERCVRGYLLMHAVEQLLCIGSIFLWAMQESPPTQDEFNSFPDAVYKGIACNAGNVFGNKLFKLFLL